MQRAANADPLTAASLWEPCTLSRGFPGTAVLFGWLSRIDDRWRKVAHEHLEASVGALRAAPSLGLYYGTGAVAFAARTAAVQPGDYATLVQRLEAAVARDVLRRLTAMDERGPSLATTSPWQGYDVITGMAGVGRLLLEGAVRQDHDHLLAVTQICHYLVGLTRNVAVEGHQVPGWWVPHAPGVTPGDGHFSPGMAHGVAGPLAFLALALKRGIEVAGHREAVDRVASWLCARRIIHQGRTSWPLRLSLTEELSGAVNEATATRAAWCYGTAGTALALYWAGRALGRGDFTDIAVQALLAALRSSPKTWNLEGVSLCHGLAGLLVISLRISLEADREELRNAVGELLPRLLDSFDEEAPFGYRHQMAGVNQPWSVDRPTADVNICGVLEGAAGVALTLLGWVMPSMLKDEPLPWDAVLLAG